MPYNYNTPFGVPNYYPAYQPTPQPQQAQGNSPIWVSGEAGAKAFLVAPNSTVALWDSEAQTIYLKSADASGMPSMKVLDYSVRDMAATPKKDVPEIDLSEYITKKDFDAFEDKIKKQIKKLSIRSVDEDE